MNKQFLKLNTKAFTIIELLVVLVISAIIISMGSVIYLKIQKYLNEEIVDRNINNEQIWFLNKLESEVLMSDKVIGDKDLIRILKDSTLDVTYQLYHDKTVRITSKSKDSIKTTYAIESILYLEEFPEYISSLVIKFGSKDTLNTITIQKKYLPFVVINALTSHDKLKTIKKWD